MDILLFPDDQFKSYYISLTIGISISIILMATEELIRRLHLICNQKHWLLGLMLEDIFKFIAVAVALVLWRGGWGMMKDYVIVGSRQYVDSWLYHGVGMIGLMMLNASSSVSPFGCHVDMEEDEFLWPMRFCSLLCQNERPQRLHIQVKCWLSQSLAIELL